MSRTMQILNTQFCRNSVEINEVRNLSLLCKLHTYIYFHRSKSCLHRRSLHINTECALWILANHSNLITTHFKLSSLTAQWASICLPDHMHVFICIICSIPVLTCSYFPWKFLPFFTFQRPSSIYYLSTCFYKW